MKKCNDCNVEMIEGVEVFGQQHFEIGPESQSTIYLNIPTGKKFLGFDRTTRVEPLARICPKCGKVELYVNIEE